MRDESDKNLWKLWAQHRDADAFATIVARHSRMVFATCRRILGNAADERILREAGIERAVSLVAAANSDAENVFIILTAKSMQPNLHLMARCNSEASVPKLEMAGANTGHPQGAPLPGGKVVRGRFYLKPRRTAAYTQLHRAKHPTAQDPTV